jgi:hypothetical protein
MELRGRRIHIAGSAALASTPEIVRYAGDLVRGLVLELGTGGGAFVIMVGREPAQDEAEPPERPIVFDWAVLETMVQLDQQGSLDRSAFPSVIAVVTTKTEKQIPNWRRELWLNSLERGLLQLAYIEPDWTSAAIRRNRAAHVGDLLICVSGGEGVHHLAREYAELGKPVVPLDLDAGGSTEVGPSSSAALHKRALADPRTYFNSGEADGGAALLTRTKTDGVKVSVGSVARAVADLIRSLAQPSAFLVRMLDTEDPQLTAVDRFFEEVVVPVLRELGYDPIVMGEGRTDSMWMNVDIFERLSRCQMTVVDITGLRNNCFMELGYAYGRGLRVLLTGEAATRAPFDATMIERHVWSAEFTAAVEIKQFRDYCRRHPAGLPLVASVRL